MSDLNDPLKDSYIGKVADAITPYIAELTAKGFDPTSRVDQLGKAGALIEGAIKLRKSAEQSATEAVKNEQDLRDQFYTLAAATVSLVEGLAGKDHALTTKLRGLRADLIGNQAPGGAAATTPTSTPPAK
jgi:hypothetical protein